MDMRKRLNNQEWDVYRFNHRLKISILRVRGLFQVADLLEQLLVDFFVQTNQAKSHRKMGTSQLLI